jgi:hypothetical protein
MLRVTRDLILPTAITGSYPRPLWYDANLSGRSFKAAPGDSMFREQYLDAVAAVINAQEAPGLDIVTDGDSRFDLAVGGNSWFFYPMEDPELRARAAPSAAARRRRHRVRVREQYRPPRAGPARDPRPGRRPPPLVRELTETTKDQPRYRSSISPGKASGSTRRR